MAQAALGNWRSITYISLALEGQISSRLMRGRDLINPVFMTRGISRRSLGANCMTFMYVVLF